MITINLLPEEFRTQPKSETSVSYLKIAAVFGVLIFFLNAYFYADFLKAKGELKKVQAQWAALQPQAAELKKLEEEVEKNLKPEKDFLENFVTVKRPLTSLMGWTSEVLPESLWLTELQMEREGEGGYFLIKGLALSSKEKSSIDAIEIYLHRLKEKMPDSNLSLTTTRQTLEGRELTQFTAHFDWGGKVKA